ncbi:sensor histidine kinase [Actinacidiphila yeochonensis]|uniref:sensor histidine kinase n=1 Tax=Actinacidiphila yeochonensis TaxID=89050 RepID=UPI00068B1914|nr:histidine kinase [Actinacidiphila yeochonensis]
MHTTGPVTVRWRQYARRRPLASDAILATALFVVIGPSGAWISSRVQSGPQWLWGTLLAAAGCLALPGRRHHPTAVVVVTALCGAAAAPLGLLLTPLTLGPLMLALYWMALDHDRRAAFRWAVGITVVLVPLALLTSPGNESVVLKTLNPGAWLLLMPLVGGNLQLRRAYVDAAEARAVYAERTREEEARHRVAEERIRIARELHDVVAHHLALANAQAGTAAYLARAHPDDRVRTILEELAGTTSEALRELKATVGVLRDDDESPLHPAPGLDQLDDLAGSFASIGLTVSLSTTGTPVPVSSAVGLTAYRIAQEALTNVAKHADTGTAHVALAFGADRLTLTVTNDGPPPRPGRRGSTGPSGYGLIGMAERAQLVGGHVSAGPRGTGGFSVTAELPLLSADPIPPHGPESPT